MTTKADKKLWDLDRNMSAGQYKRILADLELSRAAAARLLGCSGRTSSRYWHGISVVDPAHAMLLRAFRDSGMFPVVPKWQPRLR